MYVITVTFLLCTSLKVFDTFYCYQIQIVLIMNHYHCQNVMPDGGEVWSLQMQTFTTRHNQCSLFVAVLLAWCRYTFRAWDLDFHSQLPPNIENCINLAHKHKGVEIDICIYIFMRTSKLVKRTVKKVINYKKRLGYWSNTRTRMSLH